MRKVILSNMVTLDGYFEGPNQSIDWHNVDGDFFEEANRLLDAADTLLFGRVTYQGMEGYWTSEAAKKDDPVIAAKMNGYSKIVFSRTLDKAAWANTRLVRDKVAEEVNALKRMPGKDMVIFGSSELSVSFLEQGLLDEVRLFICPLALGAGTPIFKGLKSRVGMKLLGSRVFGNGNVLLTYAPARKSA